jgi:hypothetical protein
MHKNPLRGKIINPWHDPEQTRTKQEDPSEDAKACPTIMAAKARRCRRKHRRQQEAG